MKNSINIKTLAKGAELFSVNTQRFKTAKISVNFAMPLRGEISANAILPYILHCSCKKLPSLALLNSKLAELYGAVISAKVIKLGEVQILSIGITSIDDRFSLDGDSVIAECAQLLTDLIFEPNVENNSFLHDDVEREKRLLLERVESEKNDKRAFALRRCEELMCENEAYALSRFGTVEQIRELDGAKIYDAWQNMLETAKIQVNIVSSSDAKPVEDIFIKNLKKLNRDKLVQLSTEVIKSVDKIKHIEEEQPINQGKLVIGFRAGLENGDGANAALRVMVDLFGGGPYSRLFTNVREKLSLCYYCSARVYRQKGIIMVQSGIETQNKEKVVEEVTRQLDIIKNGGFEDSELNSSKRALFDALQGAGDTPEEINEWYLRQITEENVLSPQELATMIESVKREDIMQVAQEVTLDTIYVLKGTGGEEE